MAISKLKFDWSSLDRYGIAGYIWSLYPEIASKTFTIDKFHSKITNHLKKQYPLRFKKNIGKNVGAGEVYVGGFYCSGYDQLRAKCIELVFEYSSKSDTISISQRKFRRLCLTISDTILHEIMHMRQYRRRNFKILPEYNSNAEKTRLRIEQQYLGCSDEIDAYSFNIACELVEQFGDDRTKIVNYLYEDQSGTRRKNNCWRMYLKAFEHDHNHPIILRVKKKVIKYLSAASLGKPYKNRDWIWR